MTDSAEPAPAGSRAALCILLALVVLSPWPFGSVHLRTTQAIAFISLTTALVAFLWDGWHGRLFLPPRPILWTLLALWALAAFQLIPLPASLHHWLAPASAFVWHPTEPAAAAVLGPGPHPISIWPDATRRWLAFATGVVALALAAAPALRDRTLLRRAAFTIVISGLTVALYSLAARVLFGNKLYGVFDVPTVAPFGPFVSKNHFAGYVELTALLAVGLAVGLAEEARRGPGWLSWIDTPPAPRIVAASGVAAALILAVPVSLSRGGVLSLTAGLGTFVLIQLGTRRSRPAPARAIAGAVLLLGLVVVTLAVALPETARDRILTLTEATTEQSGSYRLVVWRSTLGLIAASPLVGTGFGAYRDALPRFKVGAGQFLVEHAENDYLETLAEGGLVAGTLLATVIGFVVVLGFRIVKAERSRVPSALRSAAVAGLVAASVHAAFDFNQRIPSNALCVAALTALLLAPTMRSVGTPDRRRQAAVLSSTGLALIIALTTPWAWKANGSVARMSADAAPRLRRSAAETALQGRLRERPAHGTTWVQLAWIRRPDSASQVGPLSQWGTDLDPSNLGLRRAAEALQP
jgi:O-antigen ligase